MDEEEVKLINIAQKGTEEEANEAMKTLRSKYDDTYHYCEDWDGLVISQTHIEFRTCTCFDNV